MASGDQLPRIMQANIYRFYLRVAEEGVSHLPVHAELVTGEASTLETYLDRAEGQVDNYTANEANKAHALALIAIFERYLRLWGRHVLTDVPLKNIMGDKFLPFLATVAAAASIDLEAHNLKDVITEIFHVGNVVRHGDGKSLETLAGLAPQLIDRSGRAFVDLLAGPTPDSEWLRIGAGDLERYMTAMVRFWGLADPMPGAVTRVTIG